MLSSSRLTEQLEPRQRRRTTETNQVRLEGYRQALRTATTIAERYKNCSGMVPPVNFSALGQRKKVDQLRSDVAPWSGEVAQLQAAREQQPRIP